MASNAMNGEELQNPLLPDDLLVSCLARVSRSYYPSLSLVSKSFGSLLASLELYKTRSLLGCTESCLYVCLQYPRDSNPRWFTLCPKPNQTLTSKKKKGSSSHLLAPVSFTNLPPVEWTDLISVDHRLYAVCKPMKPAPCSNVSYLDCRTHTWLESPSFRFTHGSWSSVHGNMYFPGSYENPECFNCIQRFNMETQTWKTQKGIFEPSDMEGKVYQYFDGLHSTVKLKENKTEWIGMGIVLGEGSYCKIGEIAYVYCPYDFVWYDIGSDVYRKVEGLEELVRKVDVCSSVLVDYGGKLVVFWDKYLRASFFRKKKVWCAVISLEKRGSEEIWGKVEWLNAVLTVPRSYKFIYAITATV